ncbi:MAG TPA: hypothetical protein PLS69_12795 [Terricaulis sp.]|nr:hypothetical protein [Terricaulis sp.]
MRSWILPIVLGGLIAGALDIGYAFAHYYAVYQVPPLRSGRRRRAPADGARGFSGLACTFFSPRSWPLSSWPGRA